MIPTKKRKNKKFPGAFDAFRAWKSSRWKYVGIGVVDP
jgi:hypothetical protein